MAKAGPEWVVERTLGGRPAEFWWRADEEDGLAVQRAIREGQLKAFPGRSIRREEVEALVEWLDGREWVDLLSSPRILRERPEQQGLGRFLAEALGWPATHCIFASHFAAVLVRAGVLEWNGATKYIRFRLASRDLSRVGKYYEQRRAEQAEAEPASGERRPQPPARRPRRIGKTPTADQPRRFDLGERFRARGRELRAQFDACTASLHSGETGSRRDAVVAAFLRSTLKGPYVIGRGEVVEASGQASRQVDVLVYDRDKGEELIESDASLVVAAECVYAAIEVKPVLDGHHLVPAVDNIRSVKALDRTAVLRTRRDEPHANPPVFGAIFAFASTEPQRLLEQLAEMEGERGHILGVDAVCLLDRALIFRYPGIFAPAWMADGGALAGTRRSRAVRVPLGCIEAGGNSLLLFQLLLKQRLRAMRLLPPDLAAYVQGVGFPEPTFA